MEELKMPRDGLARDRIFAGADMVTFPHMEILKKWAVCYNQMPDLTPLKASRR
jgi:hypothetical protein